MAGTRPVRGQRQLLRQPGELLAPVRHLPASRLSGSSCVAEQLPLPERVVGVLHRQRRPAGRLATTAARRTPPPRSRASGRQRPAVRGDVVQQQQQHVLARRGTCSSRAAVGSGVTANSRTRIGSSAARSNAVRRRFVRSRHRSTTSNGTPADGSDLLVRLTVDVREHACAAPRAGRPRPTARPAAPSRSTRRTGATPAGCCRSRLGPSSRCRNHSRRWANDSGITRPLLRCAPARRRPPPSRSSSCVPSAATVGCVEHAADS